MKSLTNVRKFYKGFTLWDWWVIYVVSKGESIATILALTGSSMGFIAMIASVGLWKLYLWDLHQDFRKGKR